MKIKYLVVALLPLSLMACQTVQNVTDNVISQINTTAAKNLTEYNWTYQGSKASKPLVLSFDDNQRLSIQTGCNNQGGTWKVEGNTIVTSPLASTMMACADDLMQQERLSADIFSEKKVPFTLSTQNDQTILTITDSKGQKYTFLGKMTAEAKYQSEGKIVFLEISPQTKSCTGVAPQTCMQVREIKYDDKGIKTYADKNWSLYYGQIEDFEHNPNQRVIVRVKRFQIKNPAADQSSIADVLDMVVEQEIVKKP
jgi:heat shock protein HslJ